MDIPRIRSFKLNRQLSTNALCQSWLATEKKSGRPVFLKLLSPDERLGLASGRKLMEESFGRQQHLSTTAIVSARRRVVENGALVVEYPYLDPEVWQPLTPEILEDHPTKIMTQVARVVDYLHLQGFVHCDLKLDNFLVRTAGDSISVRLVDLDFLSSVGETPNGRILGTPEHIAPEVLANDRVLPESDNYSLGVSLRRYLSQISPKTKIDDFSELIDSFTAEHARHRPRYLLDALHQHKLIDDKTYDCESRRLLAQILLTQFRRTDRSRLDQAEELGAVLRTRCRVIGLHDDFLGGLADLYSRNRRGAYSLFIDYLSQSRVSRSDEFWWLDMDDGPLLSFYRRLDTDSDRADLRELTESFEKAENSPFAFLHVVRELRERGQAQRPFVYLQSVWQQLQKLEADQPSVGDGIEAITGELARLALSLNRQVDCADYQEYLLERLQQKQCTTAELAFEIGANRQLSTSDPVGEKFFALAVKQCPPDSRVNLYVRRARLWSKMHYEPQDEGIDRELVEATKTAHSMGYHDEEIRMLYLQAIRRAYSGATPQAVDYLKRALAVAQEHDLPEKTTLVRGYLADQYSDLGLYHKSLEKVQEALELTEQTGKREYRGWLLDIAMSTSLRLADFRSLDDYMHQAEFEVLEGAALRRVAATLGNLGFCRLWRTQLSEAEDLLLRAQRVGENAQGWRARAKQLHNLIALFLYEGRSADLHSVANEASQAFEEGGDLTARDEIHLLVAMHNILYEDTSHLARVADIAESLAERRSCFVSLHAAFFLLLYEPRTHQKLGDRIATVFSDAMEDSSVPMFAAVNALRSSSKPTAANQVAAVKAAFKIFHDAEDYFHAMLCARECATLYQRLGRSRHALTFFRQALRLAESLRNRPMMEMLADKIKEVSSVAENRQQLVDSFHGVSLILNDLTNYREALRQIMSFAVDQTGAERGVLLLKQRNRSDMYVGAAVNCDDRTLSEIADFSRTIPLSASEELAPIVIDNALTDERTKKYQSIVYHNILSVVCVPLIHNQHVLGALYLDHHTIPSLFEQGDLKYIQAIANFVAAALVSLQDFRRLSATNLQLREDLQRYGDRAQFITRDESMQAMLAKIPQIAASNAPVLITGESGTGKEILAEMLHSHSTRRERPLIKLNCAAFADGMVDAELFGITRNAATGVGEREGKFAAADDGTLFLDEIGNMPPDVQAKVLRVLEYKEFEKVGTNRTTHVDVRVIAATNIDIARAIEEGKFRLDLFHRINTFNIEISPLRERRGDIPVLIDYFIKLFSVGRRAPRLTQPAMRAFIAYGWPGNVRQLRNAIEELCITHAGKPVGLDDLLPAIRDAIADTNVEDNLAEATEKSDITRVLIKHNWNMSRAARELGMPLSTFRRRMKKYGIKKPF